MAQDNPSAADRRSTTRTVALSPTAVSPPWLEWLERRPHAGRVVMVLSALGAGLLFAPDLRQGSYPSGPELVGTVATENIKAPSDITVEDTETTTRLRDEAAGEVHRIFDLDVALGQKKAETIVNTFATMRERAADVLAAEGDRALNLDRLSPTMRAKVEQGILASLKAARPEVEKALGFTLRDEEAAALERLQYSQDLASALAALVRNAMTGPVVAERSALEPDVERGITIQRIPADGAPPKAVADVSTIPDVDRAARQAAARVDLDYATWPEAKRDLLVSLVARLVAPNLTVNRAATQNAIEEARRSVTPVYLTVKKGEMIVRDGERITRRHAVLFAGLNQHQSSASMVLVLLGVAMLASTMLAIGVGIARRQAWWESFTVRDLLFLASLFLALLAGVRIWLLIAGTLADRFSSLPLSALLFVMPLGANTMVARLVLRPPVAMAFAVQCAVMVGLMAPSEHGFTAFALVALVLGAARTSGMSARSDLLRVAWWQGLGQLACVFGLLMYAAETNWKVYAACMVAAVAGGLLSGFVALAITPLAEAVFGYTTDLKLLELANLNHPALKELIVQAPGSYHHSIIVGTLVEAAAEACGANPLLARVMAYYHDLGKGCNPLYFIENQRAGDNPHDKLKPSMSAMIIKRHVTDGLDIARRHHLGEAILAGINEHHGTTLIQYFFHKAKEGEDSENPVSEQDYRYPGRKPQTREAALVMLGDSIEAASRSLADPTPARLQGLVTRIINQKFTDGQLEECDLTLRDLHAIARAFSRVLNSIYHHRPQYPGVLSDISGPSKKQHADSRGKQAKPAQGEATDSKESKEGEAAREADQSADQNERPDNIRRLGLS